MSKFLSDLKKEQALAKFLDVIYREKLQLDCTRVGDINLQYKGVDFILAYKGQAYRVDEKAQLHYIGKDLPTFAFEIKYYKYQEEKLGWLFDSSKETDYYFLITAIQVNTHEAFTSCKITSVNRWKLIKKLDQLGLTYDYLAKQATILEKEATNFIDIKRQSMPVADAMSQLAKKRFSMGVNGMQKSQGYLMHSPRYAEKPTNLILKLDYLRREGIAKEIYSGERIS